MKTIIFFLLLSTAAYADDHYNDYYYNSYQYNEFYGAATSFLSAAAAAGFAAAMAPKPEIILPPQTPYPAQLEPPKGCDIRWVYSYEYQNYIKVCIPYQ